MTACPIPGWTTMYPMSWRARVAPSEYFSFTSRMRYNPYSSQVDFGDALFNVNVPHLRLNGGYIWEPITPYYYYATDYRTNNLNKLYTTRTSEISGGVSVYWSNWHASIFSRRSLSRQQFVTNGVTAGYGNDCFGIDFMYLKQYTSIGGVRVTPPILSRSVSSPLAPSVSNKNCFKNVAASVIRYNRA